jgi:predicted cupin superfamily sugar epimerase
MHPKTEQYIKQLSLSAHPEGGYFAELYRSSEQVRPLAPRYEGTNRSSGSLIYFLLDTNDFSAWHRLKSDEAWHYYDGSAIRIYIIRENGLLETRTLGNVLNTPDSVFQTVIPHNCWFAAELVDKNAFGLVGCSVYPAFDFADFELANRAELSADYPQHSEIIEKLTRAAPACKM